eukprot:6265273-Pyramimonas_sp.AAC.1
MYWIGASNISDPRRVSTSSELRRLKALIRSSPIDPTACLTRARGIPTMFVDVNEVPSNVIKKGEIKKLPTVQVRS